MSDAAKSKKATLTDSEITTSRGFGRRAFLLGTFGGTAALAGCVETTTIRSSGVTDSDLGAYADPVGGGRGRSGITDSDVGAYADPVGRGRGRRACTDSDLGSYADPVGGGRRC
ncbi:hypothetical protein JI664_00425 [Rhodobacter sp. NTK016B]|uniref:hypothetical protein n=1 Tax=Rhodobacter sp. NTK016B TaxID=2759676 RepID=UPI001A8CBE83|nr:hypothetical protein [Rhodobacter sp. NTK016B]MBN8290419.1 hypothetical protein [Rhodobacter sp. NTK016B]